MRFRTASGIPSPVQSSDLMLKEVAQPESQRLCLCLSLSVLSPASFSLLLALCHTLLHTHTHTQFFCTDMAHAQIENISVRLQCHQAVNALNAQVIIRECGGHMTENRQSGNCSMYCVTTVYKSLVSNHFKPIISPCL